METGAFRVLGISGSLRRRAFNRGLLSAAQDVAPPGMTIELFDLAPIPLFNADVEAEGDPHAVQSLKQKIRQSDALLIATPEYNRSIPGVLKNAVDWASRGGQESALRQKPVAIMGASGGTSGTMRSQVTLRDVLHGTESLVLPRPEIYVPNAGEKFDGEGRLIDDKVRERIRTLLVALMSWARAFQGVRV